MTQEITGRVFESYTNSTKDESGDWTVVCTMIEKLRVAGSNEWKERKLQAQCTHNSMETAYDIAMNSVLEQFNDRLEASQGNGLLDAEDYPTANEIVEEVTSEEESKES